MRGLRILRNRIPARKGLIRDRSGATALEFALVALPFFMLAIGIIVVAERLWAWQSLSTAAADVARCAGIANTSCASVATSTANTVTYATKTAGTYGFSGLTASNVTVSTGSTAQTACNNTTASVVYVKLSYTYTWTPLSLLPATISGSACFPLASS